MLQKVEIELSTSTNFGQEKNASYLGDEMLT